MDRSAEVRSKLVDALELDLIGPSKDLLKRINVQAEVESQLLNFDKYLKSFHYNPGTCADLTVTTLLISKIRDIFKFQI